ncbi:hypothetical protein HY213_02805 [Candidatus Peregrinibacteria bacterium]|nr:hypothetical protein [Candidatus Peregrinibacteria bacterium]
MIWGVLILLALLVIVFLCGFHLRKGRFFPPGKKRFRRRWIAAQTLSDTNRRVLEGDKVLDALLMELGFRGTLGEKLRAAEKKLADPNAVWRAHKLRNRIAHEAGFIASEREADAAMRAFESVIRSCTR